MTERAQFLSHKRDPKYDSVSGQRQRRMLYTMVAVLFASVLLILDLLARIQ